jgi:hypothetical protein
MHRVAVDDPAAGARVLLAGQLDDGDELVVLVDVGVGQDELGQGEQQLGPPLDRGRVRHAYGLGRSDGFAPRASRPYVSSPSIRSRVTHYRGEDPEIANAVDANVVDGDTVDVRTIGLGTTERVRVIGIDTPERGECGFGPASSASRA